MNEDTKNKMAAIMAAAQAKANNKTTSNFSADSTPKKEVKVLGQTVTQGTKIHAKLLDQVKQFNDLAASEIKQPEMSTMTFSDLVTDTAKPESKKATLKLVDYSDKAFAIVGETKPIKDQLKQMGGRFNYYLTCGAGWIFPKTKAYTVRKALNLI